MGWCRRKIMGEPDPPAQETSSSDDSTTTSSNDTISNDTSSTSTDSGSSDGGGGMSDTEKLEMAKEVVKWGARGAQILSGVPDPSMFGGN